MSALTLDTAWYVSCFTYKIITFFDVPSHALRLHLHVLFAVLTSNVFLLLIWPLSLSLATTRKISVDFFSSAYLDVSVRRVPSVYLCIQYTVTVLDNSKVSPFGYPRLLRLFAAHRGFSQLITSFFGSRCQGIPLVLFLA